MKQLQIGRLALALLASTQASVAMAADCTAPSSSLSPWEIRDCLRQSSTPLIDRVAEQRRAAETLLCLATEPGSIDCARDPDAWFAAYKEQIAAKAAAQKDAGAWARQTHYHDPATELRCPAGTHMTATDGCQ